MDNKVSSLIAFTGGGTGGHVYPGLAVIDELKTEQILKSFRLCWLGSSGGMERAVIKQHGIDYVSLPAGKLRRYFSLRNLIDLFKVAWALLVSLIFMLRRRPVLLFSKGGYVSVPPVIAARICGIPVITHESDFDPGLATRINARFASIISLSYRETADYFRPGVRKKLRITGNPIRREILSGDPRQGRTVFGLPGIKPLIVILGGSLGARQINLLIEEIAPCLLPAAEILHQTGEDNLAAVKADAAEGYVQRRYINSEMADILAAADLVIGRAGAGTLWECGSLGKAMVLIPLDASGSRGDQLRNAELFRSHGAAEVLSGRNLSADNLATSVLELINAPERRAVMGFAARELTALNGSRENARLIREILKV